MYLILEYAHNGSLHGHISKIRTGDGDYIVPGTDDGKGEDCKETTDDKQPNLSENEILSFASQIANGMEYMASKNVSVHHGGRQPCYYVSLLIMITLLLRL